MGVISHPRPQENVTATTKVSTPRLRYLTPLRSVYEYDPVAAFIYESMDGHDDLVDRAMDDMCLPFAAALKDVMEGVVGVKTSSYVASCKSWVDTHCLIGVWERLYDAKGQFSRNRLMSEGRMFIGDKHDIKVDLSEEQNPYSELYTDEQVKFYAECRKLLEARAPLLREELRIDSLL